MVARIGLRTQNNLASTRASPYPWLKSFPINSPSTDPKAQRDLKRWSSIKTVTGILVILSTVFMVGSAVGAFLDGEDTSRAMKLPFALAVVLSILYFRSVRRVLEIQATSRR